MSDKSSNRTPSKRPPSRLELLRSERLRLQPPSSLQQLQEAVAGTSIRQSAAAIAIPDSTPAQNVRPNTIRTPTPSPVVSDEESQDERSNDVPSHSPLPQPESPDSRFWSTRLRLSRPLSRPAPRQRRRATDSTQGDARLNSNSGDRSDSRTDEPRHPSPYAETSSRRLSPNLRGPSPIHDLNPEDRSDPSPDP